jgi:hypothetical protein
MSVNHALFGPYIVGFPSYLQVALFCKHSKFLSGARVSRVLD